MPSIVQTCKEKMNSGLPEGLCHCCRGEGEKGLTVSGLGTFLCHPFLYLSTAMGVGTVIPFSQLNKTGVKKVSQVAPGTTWENVAECRDRVFFIHTRWAAGAWYFTDMVRASFIYVFGGPEGKCEEKIITEPKSTLHVFWPSNSKKGCCAVLLCLGRVGEGKRAWEVTQSCIVPANFHDATLYEHLLTSWLWILMFRI